jgi:hypothetical protein
MKRDSTSPPQNLSLRKHLKKLSRSDKYSEWLLRCSCGGNIAGINKKTEHPVYEKNAVILLRISEKENSLKEF